MSPYGTYSDGVLVDLCLEGDRLAWETLILRYKRLMYSIPAKYRFDESECEDVVHDVCITLLKGLHALRDRSKVYSWLMTTTNRECLALAAQKRKDVVERKIEEPLDPAGTQEETMSSTEKQQVLREVLEIWRDPCSLLIKTLYFEQRSYEEAAERLGVSPEGIGARRARCFDRLRRMLAERGITSL